MLMRIEYQHIGKTKKNQIICKQYFNDLASSKLLSHLLVWLLLSI